MDRGLGIRDGRDIQLTARPIVIIPIMVFFDLVGDYALPILADSRLVVADPVDYWALIARGVLLASGGLVTARILVVFLSCGLVIALVLSVGAIFLGCGWAVLLI